MFRTSMLMLALVATVSARSFAQHTFVMGGSYDPNVPAPRAVLGYEAGDQFTPHHMLMGYLQALAASSKRVHVDTVAHSFEGREVVSVVISSEANQARIAQIKADAQRIADPRGTGASELNAAVERMPAIAWLGYTVHGGEASGAEAAIALMYQLAAGQDAQTRMILDSVVVIIDPLQNPDGHERHVQDVLRTRGAFGPQPNPAALVHQGSWPGPRTNHYYFDMNRDWYVQSQPETRGRIRSMLTWFPQVSVDLHEMGVNSTYFFPPTMLPINKIVTKNIQDWWEIFAQANGTAFDQHGWSYFRREGYDEFYPGYGDSWPLFNGAIGMTYEEASSAGGAIRRNDGTLMTLKEAAAHHYTASWATLLTTAQRRTQRLRDYLTYRQTSVSEPLKTAVRAVAFERDPTGRADSLAKRLLDNGIEVLQLRNTVNANDATPFATSAGHQLKAGAYVVDFAQPAGRLARAILEPDAVLDSAFVREELEHRESGINNRFYDLTAWAMPYTFGVNAWTLRALPAATERVTSMTPAASAFNNAQVAYAFEPGSETSLQMLAGLLADSVRVHYASKSFRLADVAFPQGAFVVRVASNNAAVHDAVKRNAATSGARVVALNSGLVTEGTDLGSNSVVPIRPPRVALVGGQGISGSSFGTAWYVFDQRLRFPVTNIDVSALNASAINEFNVIVMPSAGSLDAVLTDAGRARLASWVRDGGLLITLDGATQWLASDSKLALTRLKTRRDSTRADNKPGAPPTMFVPGAIVGVRADTLSPILAGVRARELAGLVFSDRVYVTPKDFRPGEVVLKYADEKSLRIAGYMWPEVPARLAGTPYLWTERVGRGRIIAFAGDPNFRDMWRGMYPLFANAVLLGGSY